MENISRTKPTLTQRLRLVMSPEDARAAQQALQHSERSAFALWCAQLFAWLIGKAEERGEAATKRDDEMGRKT